MDDSVLSKKLLDAFHPIVEMQQEQFQQIKTMLAGFIALKERDINYMDRYMDALFNFMDPQSDVEMLMRQYYDYISTFDAQEAKERLNQLNYDMGYKTKIIYAAGILAKRLHQGQSDKGGHNYFDSHLLKVAKSKVGWKEKVVGFLHDTAEDTSSTTIEVMAKLESVLAKIISEEEFEWWEDWMEDIAPYACEPSHMITDEERREIITALDLLNHHTATTREEYISQLSQNPLALRVKLKDLENNMDIARISEPTKKDIARMERYKKEYNNLLSVLHSNLKNEIK